MFVPLLHVQIQIFLNETFDIAPCPFYQCIIIKVFDAHFQIFIPVAWIFWPIKLTNAFGRSSTGLLLLSMQLQWPMLVLILKEHSFPKSQIIFLVPS